MKDLQRELERTRNGAKIMERMLEDARAEIERLREACVHADDALTKCIDALLHDGVPVDMAHPKRQAIAAADVARAALNQQEKA